MVSSKSRKKASPVTSAHRSAQDSDRHSQSGRLIGSKRSEPIAKRINQVREGLPISELNTLANVLGISRDQLTAILGVTTRTLQRKAEADDRLGPVASDRLARV